jgi:protein-disulfide isomerase
MNMAKSKKKKASKKDEVVINLDNAGVPIAILISGILIASVVYFASKNSSVTTDTAGVSTEPTVEEGAEQPPTVSGVATLGDGPILGDLDTATVAIVEYNEFQCGYCKRHVDETFPLIKENYIDTGKVVYVFKEFAIYGDDTANAGKCVYHLEGVDAYKEFHIGGFEVEGEEDVYALAKEVGVDEGEFDECYTSKTYQSEIDADKEEGTSVGVQGTPGFVVGRIGEDGTVEGELVAGAYPYDTFVETIEALLK